MTSDEALLQLLERLRSLNYEFTAVTPATHARVLGRPWSGRPTLRDILGWSRTFQVEDLEPGLFELMRVGGALQECKDGKLRSRFRVASLGADLFLHSAFPTSDVDSVFFGPDTYRFAAFVREELRSVPAPGMSIADLGTGSGAGAVAAARERPGSRLTLVDINPEALRLARINLAFAAVQPPPQFARDLPTHQDVIIANPPYMIDAEQRTYRDGGEIFGGGTALQWAEQGLQALRPGGRMLLYTGAAVVGGGVPLIEALSHKAGRYGAHFNYAEVDPDVFGEELSGEAYAEVDRIAIYRVVLRT